MDHNLLAAESVELCLPSIKKLLKERAKRQDMHIVIMDPRYKAWEKNFEDSVLYEYSLGDKASWSVDFQSVALQKAEQSWRVGHSNMYTHLFAPASLRVGDVAFYGSFDHNGIIVAASGVESWFDVLVSGWIAVAFQQLAQEWYNNFKIDEPMAPVIKK